jgi:hypothetical protein
VFMLGHMYTVQKLVIAADIYYHHKYKIKEVGMEGGRGGVQCCLYTQRSSCNGVNNHKL